MMKYELMSCNELSFPPFSPKLVFHTPPRKYHHDNHSQNMKLHMNSQECHSPQHEEIVKFVHDSESSYLGDNFIFNCHVHLFLLYFVFLFYFRHPVFSLYPIAKFLISMPTTIT